MNIKNNFNKKILFIIYIFSLFTVAQETPQITFEDSMRFDYFQNKISFSEMNQKTIDQMIKLKSRFDTYKEIYNKNNLSKINTSSKPIIPKKIHQIWLGSPFPKEFKYITEKWIKLHPDWEYKLWTDKDVSDLFPLYNQEIYYKSRNFGEKSDILRYEILYRFGGFYVDIDYECIKPFNILSQGYNFVVGVEPIDTSHLSVGNAIIGSTPNHPILKKCVETIKNFRNEKCIPLRTGPAHLTRSLLYCINENEKELGMIMTFPTSYLYPLGYGDKDKELPINSYIRAETFGVHYWSGTWLKKKQNKN